MTVQSDKRSVAYQGTTQAALPYDFKIFDETDLRVYKNGARLTLGSDYTVTGAGQDSGGEVVLASPPQESDRIFIERVLPFRQGIVYPSADSFPSATHENGLDKAAMRDQQLRDELQRALRLPPYSPSAGSVDLTLPEPAPGLGLGWSQDGSRLANLASPGSLAVSAFAETLLDDADAAAARQTLGVEEWVYTRPFYLSGWRSDPLHPAGAAGDGAGAVLSGDDQTWLVNAFGAPSGKSFSYVFEGYAPQGVAGTLELALDTSTNWNLPVKTIEASTSYQAGELVHLINAGGGLYADGRYGEITTAGTTNTTIPDLSGAVGTTVGWGTAMVTIRGGGWEQFASASLAVSANTTFSLSFTSTMSSLGWFANRRLRLRALSSLGVVLTGCKVTPA